MGNNWKWPKKDRKPGITRKGQIIKEWIIKGKGLFPNKSGFKKFPQP